MLYVENSLYKDKLISKKLFRGSELFGGGCYVNLKSKSNFIRKFKIFFFILFVFLGF